MAMAIGIFVGTGMDVKAADTWRVEPYTPENLRFGGLCGDCISDFSSEEQIMEAILFAQGQMSTHKDSWVVFVGNGTGGVIAVLSDDDDFLWITKEFFKTVEADLRNLVTGQHCFILRRNITPSSSEGTSGGEASSSAPHTHSYSWVTVQEVSSEQDGIEEYRCSCGDVQERCVIPRYMAIVKGLFGEIKNAPQNGTATFDSGRLYTISDYVIKKLAERTDVTTVITFEYQNQAYKMTIPAGADFTGLLADEEYFYGYFFFANAVGATIEAI